MNVGRQVQLQSVDAYIPAHTETEDLGRMQAYTHRGSARPTRSSRLGDKHFFWHIMMKVTGSKRLYAVSADLGKNLSSSRDGAGESSHIGRGGGIVTDTGDKDRQEEIEFVMVGDGIWVALQRPWRCRQELCKAWRQ